MIDNIQEILDDHLLWLKTRYAFKPQGKQADLSGMDLSGMNLSFANFSSAHLHNTIFTGAYLYKVNFSSANLSSANLSGTNLSNTDLSCANLSSANLSGADLSYTNCSVANFSDSDLCNSNLPYVNFFYANLFNSKIRGANLPSPSMMLLANWGTLSDEITKLAMAYDAFFHHNKKAFSEWVKSGRCPYADVDYQRACNFREKKELWDSKAKCPKGFNLMVKIIKEKCANSNWHEKG